MSSRELAFVKDVGFKTRPLLKKVYLVTSGWDLRITESEFTISHGDETLVIGGAGTTTIPLADVKHVSVKNDRTTGFHLLSISYYSGGRRFWNVRRTGEIALREFQFAQVVDALNNLPVLKGKLSI